MKSVTYLAALSAIALIAACSENHDHAGHAEHKNDAPAVVEAVAAPSQVQDGISVQNAWVRPTVGEQDATGGYLTITSEEPLALVGVASPAAEISEVHEMKMDGDIMRMRMAERIELKAGEPLELKPGGYHLMLMSLTAPIQAGQEVELSLLFEKPDGSRIEMPVKAVAGQNAAGGGHHDQDGHGDHKH
ncbi:MAG: copper chaperone PCu(A)C [Limnobacter sp.]|uniref:copper chaperone PCu(A)C n=1 Tax=Limnobacter sp. TaxID=2003368 RepID=UPI0022BBF793|nr:copper chaperone PCu(A)C [Limnobacter sp.]MCZ8016301.1 copper chaperone PCu(A)C [Limnobacter sp.]